MAGFYTARDRIMPSLLWPSIAPPFTVEVHAGLVKRADKKVAIEAGILKESMHNGKGKPKADYSQKLVDDLNAIKLGARQNAMVNKAEMLLDLLAFQLSGVTGYNQVLGMRFDHPRNQPETETGFSLDDRLTAPREVSYGRFDTDLGQEFVKFQAKGKKHRNAELSRHLAALLMGGDDALSAMIDVTSGANIRNVWTPTAENFFKRVNGAYLENLHQNMLGMKSDHKEVKVFAKLKKGEKATYLEKIFGDENTRKAVGLDADQIARIDAWLPDYFG